MCARRHDLHTFFIICLGQGADSKVASGGHPHSAPECVNQLDLRGDRQTKNDRMISHQFVVAFQSLSCQQCQFTLKEPHPKPQVKQMIRVTNREPLQDSLCNCVTASQFIYMNRGQGFGWLSTGMEGCCRRSTVHVGTTCNAGNQDLHSSELLSAALASSAHADSAGINHPHSTG